MFGNKRRDREIAELRDAVHKLVKDTQILHERNNADALLTFLGMAPKWSAGLVNRVTAIERHLKIDVVREDGKTARWIARKVSANDGGERRED